MSAVQGLKTQAFETREEWLLFVTNELRPHYAKCGHAIPEKVRFAIGFMATGYRSKAIGECWAPEASGDQTAEIHIRVDQDDAETVAGILAHELVHAWDRNKNGHKAVFARACEALGLEGKPKQATPGEAMNRDVIRPILKRAGKLPHKRLNATRKIKTAGTRLLKCECNTCGYLARVTAKWLEAAGAPFCGTKSHGRMLCDYEGGDE